MALSLLRKCPLLRAMPERQLRRVLRFSKSLRFASGGLIFNRKDLAQHMFIVESGSVKIYVASDARKRKTFEFLGPGSFFGEMSLLDAQQRSASAVAVQDSTLIVIHKRDFKRFLLADPKLCFLMLRTLSERLRTANAQIESLLFQNVLGRVSRTLCELGRRRGKPFRGGILLENASNRQDLADLVGTTREPLSRALASLRRAELIRFHHGLIQLRDPAKLARMAETCSAGSGADGR